MTVDGIDGQNGQDGSNGLSIVWKGDLASAPSNPQTNWCYRDTDNGKVYIYNGLAWELMVLDGSDGTDGAKGEDGLSVFDFVVQLFYLFLRLNLHLLLRIYNH